MTANADHALLRGFLERPGDPVPFDSSELAVALTSRLVAADVAAGSVRLCFDPPRTFIQGNGVLQGGIVSSMLDFAMVLATFTRLPLDRACATVSMTTHFLRPAPPACYAAVGQIDRVGRNLGFAHAALFIESTDQLIATATSTLSLAGIPAQSRAG